MKRIEKGLLVSVIVLFALSLSPVCFSDVHKSYIVIPGGCGSQHCIGEALFTELHIEWEGHYTLTRTTSWGEEVVFRDEYYPVGVYVVPGTVGEPEGEHILTLYFMSEIESVSDICNFFAIWCQECSPQCIGDDLWAMKHVSGGCVQDYIIEENSPKCGYDPCEGVSCGTVCRGDDLWAQECVEGKCLDSRLVESNSKQCGYNPCRDVSCGTVCKGDDLWSQKCVDGTCVDDYVVEHNSRSCGYNPCENHCYNGEIDEQCGEYGVDCGGGCPFKDSDLDGIEDCRDMCPNSQCSRVDMNGCETDVDSDGVGDCEDECPHDKGDSSNRGCPSNILPLALSIGGVAAAAGGVAIKGIKGKRPPSRPNRPMTREPSQPRIIREPSQPRLVKNIPRPPPEDIVLRREAVQKIAEETTKRSVQEAELKIAEEATKQAGTKIAEEATKQAGTKIAEEATKKAGTKIAEEATKKAGTKIAEEATKKAGTKIAEEATKKAGTKIAEEASKKVGDSLAGAAIGTGITSSVSKVKEKFIHCPHCGEKLPQDSKFCSKCGSNI